MSESEQEIIHGDCLDVLKQIQDASVDAVVTDPPSGTGFMGKEWDRFGFVVEREANKEKHNKGILPYYGRGGKHEDRMKHTRRAREAFVGFITEVMSECLRGLKPGGHAVVWALPRTSHWTAMAMEDAGFEIRDVIVHVFGTGFPKSLNISKKLGVEFSGIGTALKPATEHWIVARKPIEGTVAENALKYGTGGLNIDVSRIAHLSEEDRIAATPQGSVTSRKAAGDGGLGAGFRETERGEFSRPDITLGRWPANFALSHDEECSVEDNSETCVGGCPIAELDNQSGKTSVTGKRSEHSKNAIVENTNWLMNNHRSVEYPGDVGGASRFFYITKTSRAEREAGCENISSKTGAEAVDRKEGTVALNCPRTGAGRTAKIVKNDHPTVKSLGLMRWLIKLVARPGQIILDPFTGSGSTICAAALEGISALGIEKDENYVEIARARLKHWQKMSTNK